MKRLVFPLILFMLAQTAFAQRGGWNHSAAVRLNTTASGANVPGDVAGYPLAVSLNASNFDFSAAIANGADIRFSETPDGPFLPQSIEWWDPAAKEALVWVRIPLVKGSSRTQLLYMHWGNASATSADRPAEVFPVSDGFTGVWHLQEPGNTLPGGYADATANEANATGVNMMPYSTVKGVLGKAQRFRYPEKQWIKVDSDKRKLFDLVEQMTFSIWAYADTYSNAGDEAKRVLPGYETMFAKGDNSWRLQKFGIRNWHQPEADLVEICVERAAPRGDLCVVGKTDMRLKQWYHITGVHDFPYVHLYVNGKLEKTEKFDTPWKSDDHPVGIGNQSQFPDKGGRFWDGVLDEARVIGKVKDANWIKLDYESQRPGSRLLEFPAASASR
ncbi:DUF2341 domain-containing protein [Chitinophaga caseinilytica]|uniref:DUF2341 domain-containing protein n=1 Tax=Chitinophaga caseinilytica TaxID=2267521 RepID=UPI003C2C515F